jgi:CO dehydrogenase maturation factor
MGDGPGDGRPGTLKLAVAGKGGSGKTVLTCLLARALSERGSMVLAVDLDANPGLAVSLGVAPHDIAWPDSAVERRPGVPYGWGLAAHLTAAEAVRRHAFRAADKVAFLGLGNMTGVDTPLHHYLSAVRQVAAEFEEPGWVVLIDLAGGPTNAFEGYAQVASCVLVTVEATPTSIMSGRRLCEIFAASGTPTEVVLMNARSPEDADAVRRWAGPSAVVPFDPEVRRLGRDGSLAGLPADSPALAAVRQLAGRLLGAS